MDSLPTGSTQSWLIVAAVAFSPVIVLFLADAIGWLVRQARGKGGVTTAGQDASGVRQCAVLDWGGGDGHWCVRPLSPVVAFLIVLAAADRARRYCARGLARRRRGSGLTRRARHAPICSLLASALEWGQSSLNPFQTSSKKVSSGCVPDAKTDSR